MYVVDKDESDTAEDDDQITREEEDRENTDFPNESNDVESEQESNGIESEQTLVWICCVCNASFSMKKLLLHHIRKLHNLRGDDAEIVAKRDFAHDSSGSSTSKRIRMGEDVNREESEGGDDGKQWKCLECGKIYMYKSNVKCHLKKEHNVTLAESPQYIAKATSEEVAAAIVKGKENCQFMCKKCGKVYALKSSVVRHLKSYHHVGSKSTQKFFSIKNADPEENKTNRLNQPPVIPNMKRKSTVKAERVWRCKICQISFQDQKSIEEHMSKVHEMRISKSRAYMDVPLSDDEDNLQSESGDDESSGPPNISHGMHLDEDCVMNDDPNSMKTKLKQWGCMKCGGEFCHKKDALRHLRVRHYLSEQKRYTYLKKLDADENMPELEKETLSLAKKAIFPSEKVKKWHCTKCGSEYNHKSDAYRHLLLQHKIKCDKEEFIIASVSDKQNSENDGDDESSAEGQARETEVFDTEVEGEKTIWGCQSCKKIFTEKFMAEDHMRTHHNLSLTESGEEGRNILVQSQHSKQIKWKKNIEEDVEIDVESTEEKVQNTEEKAQKEWFCKLCDKSYYRRSDGARHCRNIHGVTYDEGKLLVMHISEMSEDKLDTKVEKSNKSEEEGTQHPWKCIKCHKQFETKPDIQRHLTDIHYITDQDHDFFIERNKNYITKWMCIKCGQRFFHRFDTSRHINLTHDVVWEKTKDFVQFLDDCDSSFLVAQERDDSKPYVCLICQKLFCSKKHLMTHLQKFHNAKIDAENFGKHVLSFRKVHSRNWDCISPEDADNIKQNVPLSLLSAYIMEENTEARIEDSFNVDDIDVKALHGEGPYSEENWAKIIGTSYESTCNKSTSYRPKNNIENKRFICMLCNLRYYKMKEAQRHMYLKHKISYIEAVNYITENEDVVFDQDAELPGERTPKRRKIRESNSHVFFCTLCMKAAIHFQSSQHHVIQYHKEKKENVHKKICRSQNVEVLKLGNEDKMNFVCMLCCVTFRSRIDGFKHIAKEHPMVPHDEISKFLFPKGDKMKTCVIKFDRLSGLIKIFSVTTKDILNDVKFSEEVSNIKEEDGSDSEEDKKKAIKMEKEDEKDILRECENVEDALAILLTNMSNPESFQKFAYNDFYYIFSIPAKSQKSVPVSEVIHISCPNCPREFINQHALRKHLLSCCVPNQNAWECLNCRKSFKSVGALVNHIQKMYGIQGTDVLNFMRSREILIAPENGAEIPIDGRNEQDIDSIYHSKAVEENVGEDENTNEFDPSTDERDSRKLCFVCGHRCTDRKDLFKHCEEVHFITGHNNRFTECMQCVSYFKSRKDIMNHLQNVHGVKCPRLCEKKHVCVICEGKFDDNVQLAKHVKTHGNQFSCKHCNKKFGSYSKMSTHLKIHTEKFPKKPVICGICNLSVPGESYLGHLIVHYDRKYGPWKCLVCEKDFHLRRNLREHLKGEHKTFICEKCGRTFNCMYTFKRHDSMHKSQIKCTLCSKQFDNKIELAVHKRIHMKYWICHVCGRNLSNQTALNSHLKAHKEKKLLASAQKQEKFCQICSRTFSSHEMYQKHQAIHKGDRLHSCQFCGKKYSYVGSLKLHFRSNHPEHKPYKCVVCGKTFSTFHQRFLHMREHKDYKDPIRPFKCSFCPGRFKHKMSLHRHERLKHLNESLIGFRCEKCKREFANGQSMLRHAMFCEPVHHPLQAGGEDANVLVENENTELEVVAEETVADNSGARYEVVEEPSSVQVHTINIGSEVLSFSCSEQEELILEVPEGMLVETDNGYQIIVSEGK